MPMVKMSLYLNSQEQSAAFGTKLATQKTFTAHTAKAAVLVNSDVQKRLYFWLNV